MAQIYPPFGYAFSDDAELDSDDELAVLQFALDMSDDPGWKDSMQAISHQERLEMLRENGFEIESE